MLKRADQLHNYNNDFAFATQITCKSRGGEQFGPPLDFPGMRGTGGRDPPGMGLIHPKFEDTQALENSADPDQTVPRGAV